MLILVDDRDEEGDCDGEFGASVDVGERRALERRCGCDSGSSTSSTANDASVVSTPFGSPRLAPAAGTWSMGLGRSWVEGPDRTRLLVDSSLRDRVQVSVKNIHLDVAGEGARILVCQGGAGK